jgi:hypothetical protein
MKHIIVVLPVENASPGTPLHLEVLGERTMRDKGFRPLGTPHAPYQYEKIMSYDDEKEELIVKKK